MPVPTPEELYLQLGNLVAEMPDLAHGQITPEMNRWLGRVMTLVELAGCDIGSVAALRVAAQNLNSPSEFVRRSHAQTIAVIVHQALSLAELRAPAALQGSFIAAGHTFDAFTAVGKVLSEAKADVLMVDPYADEKALTDYAVLAPEGVSVRLLTAQAGYSLKPAAEHWAQQFGETRPLAVRRAPAKTLHDRLIIVDGNTAWTLGQSFNALAKRAHTSLVRTTPPEAAALKIDAYEELWASSAEMYPPPVAHPSPHDHRD